MRLDLVWRLARYRFGFYLLSGGLVIVGALLALLSGLIIRQFFDVLTVRQLAGANTSTALALLLAVEVARYVTGIGQGVVEAAAGETAGALLRTNVLRGVLDRPGAQALSVSPGDAISRLRDDVNAIIAFLNWTLDPVTQALVLVVVLSVLARIDLLITVVAVLPVFLIVGIIRSTSRRIKRYRRANQEAISSVTNLLDDGFAGIVAVKAAGAEANVVAELRQLGTARRRAAVVDQTFSQLVGWLADNAADLGTGVLLLVAAGAMRDGRFTVGDFALVVTYLGILAQYTSGFGEVLGKLRQTEVSFDRLEALLPEAPAARLVQPCPVFPVSSARQIAVRLPDHGRDALRFERLDIDGLSYQYPGSGRGIKAVSMSLRRGTLTVVTGRVGAGKSTLLRVLLGLLPKEAGQILWNGKTIADLSGFMVPPRVAYTPQVPRLFSETLRENILQGVADADDVLERALRLAVLDRDLPQLGLGIETVVGPRGARLSGGQVQRTAAARMLVRGAELLVVDDLSSALDVVTEQALWTGLLAQAGRTVLAVSHRRNLLRRADQIVLMWEGRVAAVGSLDDLLRSSDEFCRIWTGEEESMEP